MVVANVREDIVLGKLNNFHVIIWREYAWRFSELWVTTKRIKYLRKELHAEALRREGDREWGIGSRDSVAMWSNAS